MITPTVVDPGRAEDHVRWRPDGGGRPPGERQAGERGRSAGTVVRRRSFRGSPKLSQVLPRYTCTVSPGRTSSRRRSSSQDTARGVKPSRSSSCVVSSTASAIVAAGRGQGRHGVVDLVVLPEGARARPDTRGAGGCSGGRRHLPRQNTRRRAHHRCRLAVRAPLHGPARPAGPEDLAQPVHRPTCGSCLGPDRGQFSVPPTARARRTPGSEPWRCQ